MRVPLKRLVVTETAAVVLLAGLGALAPSIAEDGTKKPSPSVTQEAGTAPPAGPKSAVKSAAAPTPEDAAAKPPAKAAARPKGSTQSIAVLVNDEPITAYEIEQRATFIALSSGRKGQDMKDKAEARWKEIVKDPRTNERFKELLKEKNVTSREEAQALQASYIKNLQQDMIEQMRRDARAGAVAGSRGKAKEELIEERLKLQEAKRLSVLASDEDVDRVIGGIAERNKMKPEQFAQHMKGMGVDISTMKARFKAEISWREVVRRRFGQQIAITDRDVDRLIATAPAGEDTVELQLQRIVVPMPAKIDQKLIAQRVADAEAISAKFDGCKSAPAIAASAGAKFEDLGTKSPSSIPEPMRSLLLNAGDGEMLPPSVGERGIELWAVCGRKVVKADEQKRETAQNELRQKEFEILAKKHLKDLRQDAAIEFR